MSARKITVLGIGNVLWADEGFGVRCVEALSAYDFAPEVQLIDGGTQGLYLLEYVQDSSHLIIFDAIDYGLEPGTLKLVENDEVPKFMGAKKMSLHQTGFQEVLMVSQLTGRYPDDMLLIGCQPEMLEDYGGSLTDVVKATMPRALEVALARLAQWGVQANLKPEGAEDTAIGMRQYEAHRPAATDACRVGDARFLNIRAELSDDAPVNNAHTAHSV